MKNLFLKKVVFVSIFVVACLVAVSLFFIDLEDEAVYRGSGLQQEFFQFENDFFKNIDSQLEALYLKHGELEVPEVEIKELSENALEKIRVFEEKNDLVELSDPDIYFRIQRLKIFVHMNVLNDPIATEKIIDELPDDENKLHLIEDYIAVFSFNHEQAIKNYLQKNENWIAKLDKQFYDELKSKVFLSAPIGKDFPNHFPGYKTLRGSELDLRDKQGKIILIDFWATWCVPCISELPYLIEANNAYGEKGFEIISISLDENRDSFLKFLREWNISWEQFFDGNGFAGPLVREYGVRSLPTTFLLGRDGKVIEKDLQGTELLRILSRLMK